MADPADLTSGARGRTLCAALLSMHSRPLARMLQRLDQQIASDMGTNYPPIGSLRPDECDLADLTGLIRSVDVGSLRHETDPLVFLVGVGAAADAAMPWQPPFIRDALLSFPGPTEALRPAADAIAAAPAASWWRTDAPLDVQYQAAGEPNLQLPEPVPATDALAAIHRGQIRWEQHFGAPPVEPGAESHGAWWSTPNVWNPPDSARLPSSTRRLPQLGAIQLAAEEDGYGSKQALLRQVGPPGESVRILEVHGPDDWIRLVAEHPLEVTRSRRGVWWESTGHDSRWFIPDWQAVADHYDAVHVSVHGYLTTAGEPLPVPDGYTVLAGWNPDETYWLNDPAYGPPERWRRTSDHDMVHWAPAD